MSSLPSLSWISAAEHVVGRIVSVNTLILLHHEDLRVHLSFLECLCAHALLEGHGSSRVDALDVFECCLDFLLLKGAFVLHELIRLFVKELQPLEYHVHFLDGHVISDRQEHIVWQLINEIDWNRKN